MVKKGITCERDIFGPYENGRYLMAKNGNKNCNSCDCILEGECTMFLEPDFKKRKCNCTECDCIENWKEKYPAQAANKDL